MFNSKILLQAIMSCNDAISIVDAILPTQPIIFVNPAFELLTGYTKEEILHKNCRFLQGKDCNQLQLENLKQAIFLKHSSVITIRNYRKDGSMFWNELSVSPVFDDFGLLTHFIGFQKDVTARVISKQQLMDNHKLLEFNKAILEKVINYDALTGIYNRRYFEERFHSFLEHQEQAQGHLVVMFIDIDNFKSFNDTYGHAAGDEALKKVAFTLFESLKRTSDFVVRYGGEEFIVLASDVSDEKAINYAKSLCLKIEALKVPHINSPHGFLTISCGLATFQPNSNITPKELLHQADLALYKAKEMGKNQAVAFETLD